MSAFFQVTRTLDEIKEELNKGTTNRTFFIISFLSYIKNNIVHNYDCDEYYPYLKLCSKYLIDDKDLLLTRAGIESYFSFLKLLVQVKIGTKLLEKVVKHKKLNLSVHQITSLLRYAKYTNFLIIIKNINIEEDIGFELIVNNTFCNFDDRVFKFVVNHKLFNENILNNNEWCVSLFSRPSKYILKRLKYLSNKFDIKKYNNIIFNGINNSDLIKPLLKYYYKESEFCFDYNKLYYFTYSLFDDNLNKIELLNHVKNELKTEKEKQIFLWVLHSNEVIIDYNELNYTVIDENNLNSIINDKITHLTRMYDYTYDHSVHSSKFLIHSYDYCEQLIRPLLEKYSETDLTIYNNTKISFLPVLHKYKITKYVKLNRCILLLKKFIKRKQKEYKITRKIKMLPILSELKNLKPSNNKKIFTNGTRFFQNKQQKFNNIPPHHLFPGELETLNTSILIKEKADGILTNSIPIDIFKDKRVKAEYIDYLDLYLVFDIDIDDSIENRYLYLRKLMYPDDKIKYVNDNTELMNSIEYERQLFNKFMDKDYDTYRWYPKCGWKVKNINSDMIEYLYDIINNGNPYICKNEYYDNDGLIITPLNGNDEIKIKPKHLMTIDLLYRDGSFYDRENNKYDNIKYDDEMINNGIYRCYPQNDNYFAKEYRYDKTHPNPFNIVDNIMNLYKIEYKQQDPLYFDKVKSKYSHIEYFDSEWNDIITSNNNNIKQMMKNMNYSTTNLDLGCGRSKMLKFIQKYSKYTGYDYDVNVLNKCVKTDRTNYNYVDLSINWNETKNKWYTVNYSHYNNIFAINSIMHFNTDTFWEQLNKVSTKGTKFMFNVLKPNFTEYKFDNSYIKVVNDKVYYYFENVHNKEHCENYVTINHIKSYLNKYNFTLEKYKVFTNNNLTDIYEWYIFIKN